MPLDIRSEAVLSLDQPDAVEHLGCYSNSAPRWVCVYTHPQAETWADSNLRRCGYQSYLPLCAARRRDRVVPSMFHTVTVPLFPRYLFVMFDHRFASWSPIRATPGVADLVRTGGSEPSYANAGAVEALRAAEALRAEIPRQKARWAPGMPCSLRKGYAFEGIPAVVTEIDGETASIAMLMLGVLRQISVGVSCLVERGQGDE